MGWSTTINERSFQEAVSARLVTSTAAKEPFKWVEYCPVVFKGLRV